MAGIAALHMTPTDEKTRAIVDAARQLFLAKGFHAASMDAIAQAANVSKRTVYNRFPSKEDLFAATIEETCRRLLPVEVPELATGESARAFMNDMAHTVLRGILAPEAIALRRIATFEAQRKPELGIAYLKHGPQFFVDSFSPLLSGVAPGTGLVIDDPKKAIWRLAALIAEPLYTHVLLGDMPADLESAIDQQINNALEAFWTIYAVK